MAVMRLLLLVLCAGEEVHYARMRLLGWVMLFLPAIWSSSRLWSMLSNRFLYWGRHFWSEMWCRYSRTRLVSISLQEIDNVIPMSANCVVFAAVTLAEKNMTVIITFCCIIEESGFKWEIDKEVLSKWVGGWGGRGGGWSTFLIIGEIGREKVHSVLIKLWGWVKPFMPAVWSSVRS